MARERRPTVSAAFWIPAFTGMTGAENGNGEDRERERRTKIGGDSAIIQFPDLCAFALNSARERDMSTRPSR